MKLIFRVTRDGKACVREESEKCFEVCEVAREIDGFIKRDNRECQLLPGEYVVYDLEWAEEEGIPWMDVALKP